MAFNATAVDYSSFGWGALFAGLLILAIVLVVAIYIYFAMAWQTIAKKRGYKRSWLAWIPIANIAMWLQLGGFHWAWIFLLIVPIAGWIAVGVLFIISNWRVFEALNYPGWLSLLVLVDIVAGPLGTIGYGVAVGIIAWGRKGKSREGHHKKRRKSSKKRR